MAKAIRDFINHLKKNNRADLTLSNYQSDLKTGSSAFLMGIDSKWRKV